MSSYLGRFPSSNLHEAIIKSRQQSNDFFQAPMSSPLYFRRFVAQFGCRMKRRFFGFSVFILFLVFVQIPLFAEATNTALAKSAIFENDVMYLRVGEVEKNLADAIQSAQ